MGELGIAILTALSALVATDQEVTLLFAGDAMMHQMQLNAAKCADGSYDYSQCFEKVKPLISKADYAVVNLETPLGGAPYSGYPRFNTPDVYVDALTDAGFDMFLTANNHTLDRNDRGLVRTVDVLNAKGLDHIGTYRNTEQRDSILPKIKTVNGYKIGFLDYTYSTNGIDIQGDVVVDYIDKDKIRSDIKHTRDAGAELICVAMHWGDEYILLPNSYERSYAKFLLDEGVDMIIGGHPHVIQPMELRVNADGKHQLLVYSLGNFISNMITRDTRGGAIVRAHLKRDRNGEAYVDAADYDLVFTIPGTSPTHNFRLVFADSCNDSRWSANARSFAKSARNIFDKYNVNVPQRK